MVLVVIYLVLFLFCIGLLTVLESSFLGLLQVSRGVIRSVFFSFLHFYIDFLKIMVKSDFIFWGVFGFFFCLLFLLLVVLFLVLFLPFGVFSGISYSFFYMFVLDVVLVFLKFYFFSLFFSKYYSFSFLSNSVFYLVFDFCYVSFFIPFLLFFLYSGFLNWDFIYFYFDSFFYVFGGFFWFVLGGFVVLFSVSSIPFDFMEVESELSGGQVLELFGVNYGIWSLFEYGGFVFFICLFVYLVFGGVFISLLFFGFVFYLFVIFFLSFSGFMVSFKISSLFSFYSSGFMYISFFYILLGFVFLLF